MSRVTALSHNTQRWTSGMVPVITAGLLFTLAMVVVQATCQLIDFHFFDLRLRILDSGHHRSVFGVISILAEAAAAGAIGACAVSRRNPGGLLAAALVCLSIIPRALESDVRVFQRYAVPILVVPLAIVFLMVCMTTFRDERRIRFIVWISLGLLACSFALHGIGPQADGVSNPHVVDYTWVYQLTGIAKHGAELAGWMLLCTGMAAAAARPGNAQLTVGEIAAFLEVRRRKVGSTQV
jgi:hypothetical protein